ncbi:plasmid mobilization relaxosome protein MobC [Streptomyces sp. NBC_01476]|uniref:plasmid mobilization relaxosome protein MobC n=1 Tax=Streptomyces sp. NBC_01476 TaxID=2903881 RepID=UPI002E320019|nr:plasmid mobilization relaxosome protein MobC [Streptomyces sp. NBC_01476]
MAEEPRREGAPGGEGLADGQPEGDLLDAAQRAVLARVRVDAAPTSSDTPAEATTPAGHGGVREMAAAFVHDRVPALDVPPLAAPPTELAVPQGRIRRFNGSRRRLRVGPVGFTEPEHAELLAAAERHGYGDTLSGYLADVALAFIRGAFTVDLPLHTDRQELQEFRAKIRWEINRIGVNINQMVYVLHRDDRIEPDIRERLERLDRLLTHIARALVLPTDAADEVAP